MEPLDPPRQCHNCGAPLALGQLACEQCHALVFSEKLAVLSHSAQQSEENGNLKLARDTWAAALPLLPSQASQRAWIESKLSRLDLLLQSGAAPPPKHEWAKKLGPLGPILILLAKGKGLFFALFKLKFLLSFFWFFSIYWSLYGWAFALGFALLILLHEFGHYVDIRRRGLPADMPVFLPGLGAYVRWNALGVTRITRAAVSLAGPFAGFLGALACLLVLRFTGNPLFGALAGSSAMLNILNLVPVWYLDGGNAAKALAGTERYLLLALALVLAVALWQGPMLIVAAGFAYRLVRKDVPPMPARGIAAYYAFLLIALAFVAHFTAGRIFPH